jgi:hypothetical protein
MARGILFCCLAVGLLLIAVWSALADEWVIAVAAAAIGLWMGDLARRDLRR